MRITFMRIDIARKVDKIRKLLFTDWDPIGITGLSDQDDEYASYASHVYGMFKSGSNPEAVAAYLGHVAATSMGLPDNYERDLRVANLALSIYQL